MDDRFSEIESRVSQIKSVNLESELSRENEHLVMSMTMLPTERNAELTRLKAMLGSAPVKASPQCVQIWKTLKPLTIEECERYWALVEK